MVKFILKDVKAIGSAVILQDGALKQKCMIITEITDIKIEGKILMDNIDFEVPNSIMSNKSEPLIVAWDYIKNTLAPQWVVDNYS